MIRQVAEVYGLRPGIVGTASLLRRALTSAAFTATVDVAGDAWSAHLGGRVAGFVSARLAEGVFAAVRVARLGLLTMEMCRPLPFAEGDKPRLSQLRAEIASWFTRFG
jgi:putative membrane protein